MLDLVIFSQHSNAYAPGRFLQEAKNLGFSAQVIGYREIKDIDLLPKSKFVILREPNADDNLYDLRDKILNYYSIPNTYTLNAKSYLKWSVFDKLLQHNEFQKAGIPHLTPLKLSEAKYPFIVKAKLGSHGSHVYKIENKSDLEGVHKSYKEDDLLIQEFQTAGFDLRAIVLGGKVLGIMKRTPKKGEFLSNYSQGGIVTRYEDESDEPIKKIALKTAKHFKLDYCGVDLMKDNDGFWKVLEVNRACQFQGFEKATGVNVAKRVLEFFTA